MSLIYQAFNSIEKSSYIGATTKSLKERKQDHLERASRGQDGKLYKALRVFGSGAFIWKIIDDAETINELAVKEKYWIKYYDSKENGYNADEGGGFKKTVYQYSVATRELVGEFEGLNSAASACNASKQDISRAALGVNNLYAGYLWSYNKSDLLPLASDKRRKEVIQLDEQGVVINTFKSVAEASKAAGTSKTCISRVCRGERKSTQGYVWKYL